MMKPVCTEVSWLWYQSNRDTLWIRGLVLVPLEWRSGQSTEMAAGMIAVDEGPSSVRF